MRAISIPLGPPMGLQAALPWPSSCLVRVPQLSISRVTNTRNYSGSRYPREHRIHSSEMIVGSSIALCTTIFLYEEYAVRESVKPKEHGIIANQRHRDPRTALEMYMKNFVLSRRNVEEGRWWTLVTHTFAHANGLHLALNMMALWSVGRPVVLLYGPVTFVALWLAAGIGGGYLQLNRQSIIDKAIERKFISKSFGAHRVSELGTGGQVGASGSILGMIGVLTCAFPQAYLRQTLAIAGVSILCVTYDVFPQIGHISHLGGMGVGAAWWVLFLRRGR